MLALEEVNQQSTMKFVDMFDRIHVDEKYFFVSKDEQRFYLAPDEPDPVRKCKHKCHIKKVRFLFFLNFKSLTLTYLLLFVTGNVPMCTGSTQV